MILPSEVYHAKQQCKILLPYISGNVWNENVACRRDIYFNNIHANISACGFAENASINPKQSESWNFVKKVEIKLHVY